MTGLFLLAALTAPVPPVNIDRLDFMSGCWSAQMGPVTIEEQWNRPLGGLMLGFSRTLQTGKAVFHEFIRIEQRDTAITYTPRVGSVASPVSFALIKSSAGEVVFENLEHDFPQRIIYRKTADGLSARIEGTEKGTTRGKDFPYKRVSCP